MGTRKTKVKNQNSIAVETATVDTPTPKGWDSVGTTTPGGKPQKKAPKATAKKTATAPTKGKAKKTAPKATAKGKTAPTVKGKAKATTTPTARSTKKGEAIELLRKGITLDKLMDKFGWQRHTVRGFMSILGKTHKVESTVVDGARTYKITK